MVSPISPMHQNLYTRAAQKIADIEGNEKHRLLEPRAIAGRRLRLPPAFAMDTMAFPQWIQVILIPRLSTQLGERRL